MKTWSRILLCSIVVSYASLWAAAASAQTGKEKKAADATLTGRWQLVVTFNSGGGTDGILRLTQEGTKVTGSFTRTSVDATVTGTLKGKSLTLSLVNYVDQAVSTLTLTGTVEDERTLKGQAIARTKGEGTDMGAEGTFVATRRAQAESSQKPESPQKPASPKRPENPQKPGRS
jgi:hypothetical protein